MKTKNKIIENCKIYNAQKVLDVRASKLVLLAKNL